MSTIVAIIMATHLGYRVIRSAGSLLYTDKSSTPSQDPPTLYPELVALVLFRYARFENHRTWSMPPVFVIACTNHGQPCR